MADVDYFSSRTAHHPSQAVSPYEIGFDRLVDLDKPSFIGKRALMDEVAAGGPPDRLVGLELDLNVFENAYLDLGYPIEHPLRAWRKVIPLTRKGDTIGRATSGTFSPLLKRSIALGRLPAKHAAWSGQLRRPATKFLQPSCRCRSSICRASAARSLRLKPRRSLQGNPPRTTNAFCG
jgi:aminomethyltransferase